MRVMQGECPSRPLPCDGCSLEPTDEAWRLISRCWAHDSGARPTIAEVCSLLAEAQATPTSTGTPQPASDPITRALVIYNVARTFIYIKIAPVATTVILAQPVLQPVPTVALEQDGSNSSDLDNKDSPVPSLKTFGRPSSKDLDSDGDPCPQSGPASACGDAHARSLIADVARSTSDVSSAQVHQAVALETCGCLSSHVGTVQAADGVQILRTPGTRMGLASQRARFSRSSAVRAPIGGGSKTQSVRLEVCALFIFLTGMCVLTFRTVAPSRCFTHEPDARPQMAAVRSLITGVQAACTLATIPCRSRPH
jgi:hypothetical protein